MIEVTLLLTALMFGGMILYSFGFAAFVFSALPADTAGPLIRRAFPHFYLFVFITAAIGAVLSALVDGRSAFILSAVAVTTLFARQVIMPAINAATDAGAKRRFKLLHSLSVLITLAHIAALGIVTLQLAASI
jgi:hypothetical protein